VNGHVNLRDARKAKAAYGLNQKVRGWIFLCSSGIRRHQTTEGETGPKRRIASQSDALGIAGNEETPIYRRAFQNIGNRQAIRKER
jgi:hypothetical protein